MRLLNAAAEKPRPPFQALVMSEESRLGREQIEVSHALKQFVTSGIRVFLYLTGTERTLDSPIDKAMLALQGMADEMERARAAQRTRDALIRKARAGYVTGWRVFGYDNVEILGPDGKRAHVEYRINEAEAAVVREIYELSARGWGMRRAAKFLNEQHALAPVAEQDRPRAWAPSSLREVLHRPLYRGEIVWATTKKRDNWGQVRPHNRPASEHVRVPAPHLRIVPEELAARVDARLAETRTLYLRASSGRLWGRPASGLESKYLLTGLCRCASCGGTLTVRSRSHGARGRTYFYACSSFHHRGRAVCTNSLEMRLADADDAILSALERDLLDPDIISEAMTEAVALVAGDGTRTKAQRAVLREQEQVVLGELTRLTQALASRAGSLTSVIDAIAERESRLKEIGMALAAAATPTTTTRKKAGELKAELRDRLKEWKRLLRLHPPQARQMLHKLIEGRILFTPRPEQRTYAYRFTGTLAKFFSGLVCPQAVASPTGFVAL